MKKALILIAIVALFTACSTTYVTVNKTVYIDGNGNTVEQGGSSLKDNTLDQKSKGTLDATIP